MHTRKHDAKNRENHAIKMEPKREAKSLKKHTKVDHEIGSKLMRQMVRRGHLETQQVRRAGGTEGEGGGGKYNIYVIYTVIYQFDIFYYIIIHQYIFDTYFRSFLMRSLEYCSKLKLILIS